MRNLSIIISSKEILETRRSLKICKIERYLGKTEDWEVEAGVPWGWLQEMPVNTFVNKKHYAL